MPRRKRQTIEVKPASTTKQSPNQYVLCGEHMEQSQLSNVLAMSHFRCGCRKCHPEFWCEQVNLNGHTCTLAGRKWPQAGNKVLCYRHMVEETSRRNVEAFRASHTGN